MNAHDPTYKLVTKNAYPTLGLITDRERAVRHLVAMAFHDLDTFWHLFSVADLTRAIALELRLDAKTSQRAAAGALFHDIGKLKLSGELLRAPRSLTPDEWVLVREHPAESATLLIDAGEHDLAAIVVAHHEVLDGSGYPFGLRGNAIPLATQLISVADAFDTMRFKRAYKGERAISDVLDELTALGGIRYDREIVAALARIAEHHDVSRRGEVVRRSGGAVKTA